MKIKVNKKKTAIILFLIVAVFICGNAIAALLGAPNIFFAIREVTDKDVELKGKDVILLEDEEVIEEIAENEEELEEVEEESEEKIKDTKEETENNIELSKTDKIFKELISEYEGKVYDDSWHKYDIKSVESVKTEFVTDNVTNNAELYKCNFTYITSDGKLQKAELAMIINLDSGDKSLAGTYENFAGSTRYTRFVGLYQETELESEDESSNNEYNISGTYYEANAVGDQPAFTFSAENKVTYGSLWMCSGTYTINKNIIKINLVSAIDPDGRDAKCADFYVEENMELTIIDANTLKDNSNEFIYRKQTDFSPVNILDNYNISGTYNPANVVGDDAAFTFSVDNKVTFGALWMCSGTYTINQNIIKINFTSAVDPDGREAKCADFYVEETMELTIIDDNTLKDNSNEFIYRKR